MKQDIINYLTGKSILILGYGREGKSALNFIQQNLPDANLAIADQKALDLVDVKTFSGENYLEHVKEFPIIGVTGTKGKSTTSSLTCHLLKEAGRDAILVGNIGIACFDAIDLIKENTIIVFEISCHQLEFVQASPHVAILLNLYEEHLDHYKSAEDYYNAKKSIYKYQGTNDTLIYGDIFQHASREEIANLPTHKIDIYHDIDIPKEEIHTHLVGDHNLHDIYAAIAACEAMGVDRKEALKHLDSFRGLPHRMEYVGEYNHIRFYNDSIATAQEAVINAVKALEDVDTLILGGMDRGLNYHPLVDFLRNSGVRNIILLPNTTTVFQKLFEEAPYSQKLFPAANMADAVDLAFEKTAEGRICLLSPAAASYGFYKNFEERGKDYCTLIKKHAKI